MLFCSSLFECPAGLKRYCPSMPIHSSHTGNAPGCLLILELPQCRGGRLLAKLALYGWMAHNICSTKRLPDHPPRLVFTGWGRRGLGAWDLECDRTRGSPAAHGILSCCTTCTMMLLHLTEHLLDIVLLVLLVLVLCRV